MLCGYLDSNQGPSVYDFYKIHCAGTWTRTKDRACIRRLLYRLSYTRTIYFKKQKSYTRFARSEKINFSSLAAVHKTACGTDKAYPQKTNRSSIEQKYLREEGNKG